MTDIQPIGAIESDGANASGMARGTRLRGAVELQILPRLVALHAAPTASLTNLVARDTVARMAVDLAMDAIGPHAERVEARLERLLDGGADPEALCLDLLAPAARYLGDLWIEDELDFVDVTLGTMRLERALRGLLLHPGSRHPGPLRLPPHARSTGSGPTILMTPLPGNQHTFGLTMAADFFRRAGWLVSEGTTQSPRPGATRHAPDALEHRLRTQSLDAIGLAVSCETQAEDLERTLRMVRTVSRNPRIRIALGGPLFLVDPGMSTRFDADLVVTDGTQAPARLAALLPDSPVSHAATGRGAGPYR